jgi:regulator of protease activity HflC (stomatin/prohibitin superfamily)
MFSLEWLGWLSDTVQTIGDLVPRRVLVEPSDVMVKFKGMKTVVVCQNGIHWYWPFMSKIRIVPAVKQTLYLGNQMVTTNDGKAVKIESSILFEVEDFVIATTKFNCYITQIDDDIKNVICKYFSKLSFTDEVVGRATEINDILTEMSKEKLKEYGILVHRVQITSVASGFSILHIDNKTNV